MSDLGARLNEAVREAGALRAAVWNNADARLASVIAEVDRELAALDRVRALCAADHYALLHAYEVLRALDGPDE